MEEIGWRGTLVGLGVVIWVVGFATTATLRSRPEPYGYRPDGDPLGAVQADSATSSDSGRPPTSTELGPAAASRTAVFWLLFLSMLLFSFSSLGWLVLQLPALEQKGFSTQLTGQAVAAYGFATVLARLGLGWIGDRLGRGRLLAASFILQGIGLGIFTLADRPVTLLPYYAFYGVGQAAYVITSQTVVADYFGTRHFVTIRGILGVVGRAGRCQRAGHRCVALRAGRLLRPGVRPIRAGQRRRFPGRAPRGEAASGAPEATRGDVRLSETPPA